jgi:hypothetical protein
LDLPIVFSMLTPKFLQLLVNKTLYEKTLASGFGVIHFIVDASEDQQFKEAALAYGLLLKADTWQVWIHEPKPAIKWLDSKGAALGCCGSPT